MSHPGVRQGLLMVICRAGSRRQGWGAAVFMDVYDGR